VNIFSYFRWLSGSIGLIVGILSFVGVSILYYLYILNDFAILCSQISFSNTYPLIIICMIFIGISVGMIDTFVLPTLTLVIDQKYSKSMYGTTFSIYNACVTFGLTIG